MVFDFSKLKLKDRPVLILETLSDKKLQPLGFATNITPHLMYNEVSTLEFSYPKIVDGTPTPHYDDLVGWNVIEWKDLGKFILVDPQTTYADGHEIKSCQAYSLEFEWVMKQIVLPEGVYNFWNPVAPDDTILGIIMDAVPSWKLGTVDGSLVGVYRSFDEQSNNLYDFVKSTLQESINCIFEFDTLTRTVNVRDVSSRVAIKPVYLSAKNLLKEINLEEDSQNIATCVDVTGADGVNIMSVNPTGLNTLYNLDYFMTPTHFSQSVIQKWNSWKTSYENNRQYYYDLSIERDLQTAKLLAENAHLVLLNENLKDLEQQQTAVIESDDDNEFKDDQLADLNEQIEAKKAEVAEQQAKVDAAQADVDEITSQLETINKNLLPQNNFTEDEWALIQRYIKEDAISDSTFVYPAVQSYNTADEGYPLENAQCNIGPAEGMPADAPGIQVTKIFHPYFEDKVMYSIEGGYLTLDNISANIISGSYERKNDGSCVLSFYLGEGTIGDRKIKSGSVAISGTSTAPIDDTVPDPDTPDSVAYGTTIQFTVSDAYVYVTENLTVFQQRSVEWDLLEWGEDTLNKLAYPTYTFDIDSANFLTIDDFEYFRKNLELGAKCYLELAPGKVISPILIGVQCSYSDLSELVLEFSDSFLSSDPTFQMKDLLEDAISMGKRVDYSKNTYSSFVNSGASSTVRDFITQSLDAARNNIVTSTDQAITWTGNGLRFRKWNSDHTDYEPEQMWAINNQLVFSDDNFNSVKTALGKILVGDAWMYGISAEALLGRFIAGNNLYIVSEKVDGQGNAVFRVDGEGAQLHNAVFDVFNGSNTQLSINPYFGIAIGKYPVFTDNGDEGYQVNEENAVFWVDLDGNLHIKGTLEAADGYFTGIVQAEDFRDLEGNSMMNGDYQFNPDYLNLLGLTVYSPAGDIVFSVSSNGELYFKGTGDIHMVGGSISWDAVGHDPWAEEAKDTANATQSLFDDLVNGRYEGGTFISGNEIYAPNIYWGSTNINPTYGELTIGPSNDPDNPAAGDILVIRGNRGMQITANGGFGIKGTSGIWTEDSEWHMGTVTIPNLIGSSGNITGYSSANISSITTSYIRGDPQLTALTTGESLSSYIIKLRNHFNDEIARLDGRISALG